MSAAYYDIQAQQGSTLRLELTVADKNGKALTFEGNADGYVPLDELPEGFEERFINSDGESIAKVFIRMQVRNAIDGNLLTIGPPEDGTDGVNDLALFGVSGYEYGCFPVNIILGPPPPVAGETDTPNIDCLGNPVVGGASTQPNVTIIIDAIHMEGVPYGKPLYEIELVYAQDIISHPKKVVYRILQGRMIITPSVTR